MWILGQNDIFCGYNVVNFSVRFFQLTIFKYLVASHVTEPGSLLTEPGAVIKFSHFSSHPGTCMLHIYIYVYIYILCLYHVQCGAVVTRSNFSQIIIKHIPIPRPSGRDMGAFFGSSSWLISRLCSCIYLCSILPYWNELYGAYLYISSEVSWFCSCSEKTPIVEITTI